MTEDLRSRLKQLALAYHKATDGTGEGEYGCPGIECPGVQRLTAFAETCAEAADAQEQHLLKLLTDILDEHPITVEAGIKALEHDLNTEHELICLPRATSVARLAEAAEQQLQALQQQVLALEQKWRRLAIEDAQGRLRIDQEAGYDKCADELATLTQPGAAGQE